MDSLSFWAHSNLKFPAPYDSDTANLRWEQLEEAGSRHPDESVTELSRFAREHQPTRELLDAVFGNSPFLSQCLLRDMSFTRHLLTNGPKSETDRTILETGDLSRLGVESKDQLMKRLRRAKLHVAAAVGIAEIAQDWPVMELTGALSDFASSCLHATCCHLLREAYERGTLDLQDPSNPTLKSGFIVLGMGKLGAWELNYSSDVDVILLYDEAEAKVDLNAHQQVFSRLARNLVNIMAKRTAEGYVFRTDLRLRPDPNSTSPSVSVRAAKAYYETVGQTWERAAMIKARPVAGDYEAGERFLESNRGFVWRRNLDFASMRDIQAVKRQINAHRGSEGISIEGHNVKLGRGGIREIEFFTQAQQLIWGGQDEKLRGSKTLDMLRALAEVGQISSTTARELSFSYEFLRRVEHRIQMVDDQQTQSLPSDAAGVEKIAVFLGYENRVAFGKALLEHLENVEAHYDSLLENKPQIDCGVPMDFDGEVPSSATLELLKGIGFENPLGAWNMIHRWRKGESRATQNPKTREMVKELTPAIIQAFARSPEPSAALLRFDDFLCRLSRGVNLFAIITARPELLDLISDIMGSAPKLSTWISREPVLLESVVQRDFADLELPDEIGLEPALAESARRGLVRLFYQLEFGPAEMAADLAETQRIEMGDATDIQHLLDIQRRWARSRKFQIGVHMLRGYLSPVEAGEPLSGIAEACLNHLVPGISGEFAASHGTVEGGQLAILAFGKLGSREMTISSDLDLIFIYDHADKAFESNGKKPLPPTQYYAKFCRRFINAVTAPTSEGRLYEVDMRLRPSGKSGPVACSLETFKKYQIHDAWTWEHQALTKARVIYAQGDLGEKIEDVFRSVLTQRRDPAKLVQDIRGMRERINHEQDSMQLNSIKFRKGGLLDIEFIAQYLQLRYGAEYPVLLARDTASVFKKAGDLSVIDAGMANELRDAAVFWRNLQGILLLIAEGDPDNGSAFAAIHRVLGKSAGTSVLETFTATLEETAELVSSHYETILCS